MAMRSSSVKGRSMPMSSGGVGGSMPYFFIARALTMAPPTGGTMSRLAAVKITKCQLLMMLADGEGPDDGLEADHR